MAFKPSLNILGRDSKFGIPKEECPKRDVWFIVFATLGIIWGVYTAYEGVMGMREVQRKATQNNLGTGNQGINNIGNNNVGNNNTGNNNIGNNNRGDNNIGNGNTGNNNIGNNNTGSNNTGAGGSDGGNSSNTADGEPGHGGGSGGARSPMGEAARVVTRINRGLASNYHRNEKLPEDVANAGTDNLPCLHFRLQKVKEV